eukprot:scaffold840_cov344-Pavlova_lutheri.AAC.133
MQTYNPQLRVLIVYFGHVPQRITLRPHREEPPVFLMNKSYSRPPSHAPSSRPPRPGIIGVLKERFFTKHPSREWNRLKVEEDRRCKLKAQHTRQDLSFDLRKAYPGLNWWPRKPLTKTCQKKVTTYMKVG